MSRNFFKLLLAAVFVVGMAGTSMADVWSECANGPSEGVSCTSQDPSVSSQNTNLSTDQGMSTMGTAQIQGPMETGSMPDRDLSGFEQGENSDGQTRNFDPSNAYPDRLWNPDPWPSPNIQAGE
jgi:hypothetical protein